MTPVEFRGDLWHQKTRVPRLSCGIVCVILRLAVIVELRLVTDRHRHRPMASTVDAQHRAVKRKGCGERDGAQSVRALRTNLDGQNLVNMASSSILGRIDATAKQITIARHSLVAR